MNKIIGIYSNNAQEADSLVRDSISAGYKFPVIYTSTDKHTPFIKQFNIQNARDVEHAKELLAKKYGKRADFSEGSGKPIFDPESLLPGPRSVVSSDVIIPYHKDVLQFVSEAVDSILNQNFARPIVHLIADGIPPSDDPVYQKYKDEECIRTYYNKKSGPYVATNRVFQFLETDYISILDSDDIAMPNRLWQAITAIELTQSDIYGGSMEQFVDTKYTNANTNIRLEQQPVITAGETSPIIHGTQTSRKSVFEDLNGYGDYFCGADVHYIRRAIAAGCLLYSSEHIVAVRRLHNASLTNNNTHGSATKFRRDLQSEMELDYKDIEEGVDPRLFGSLDLYRDSKDIRRTNNHNISKVVRPINNSEYDIDLSVPYHRNLHLVSQTIDSLLWQNGVKPLIHLVNDCSKEDDTVLKQRYGHIKNIKWYKTSENVGPYSIANSVAKHAETPFLGIVDSDDIYLPNHFSTALKALESADVWCSYMTQFLNPLQKHHQRNITSVKNAPIIKSGIVLKSCRSPRVINATMVIKTETFKALNGFDGSFFCGGDTEFTQRLQIQSSVNPTIHFHKEVTAMRRMCTNSLSNTEDRFGFQSAERTAILEETNRRFDEWEKLQIIDPKKYGNLDRQKDYLIPIKISNKRESKVYACMTTIPHREHSLEKAVASLLPQVDQLNIHLNDYDHIPEFLKNPKIQLVFGDNSLMSCTKFKWADKVKGYVFTCDDDFIYPPDYISSMIRAIDEHKCWVCAHGSKLDDGVIDNYYKNRTVYESKKEIREDVYIDVPGTGLSGFHTDDIKVSMEDINLPGMEDMAAYIHLYNNSYKVVVARHPRNWLKVATTPDDLGLFGISRHNGQAETDAINTTRR